MNERPHQATDGPIRGRLRQVGVYFGLVDPSPDGPAPDAPTSNKPEWMNGTFAGGFHIAMLVIGLSLGDAIGGSHLLDTFVGMLIGGLLSAKLIWHIPRNRFTQEGPTYWERHHMPLRNEPPANEDASSDEAR